METLKPSDDNTKLNKGWKDKLDLLRADLDSYARILIIVNDHERTTPTAAVLELLASDADFEKRSTVIIASGTHKDPSKEQLAKIMGSFKPGKILFHESRDPSQVEYFGVSSFGNELYFNKALTQFDAVLAVNSVEPHYFAGFTGGRKSFLPGLASFSTIEKNHSLALEPGAMPLKLEGNPVHSEMDQALDFFDFPIFSAQIVGTENQISDVFTGDIRTSFYEAASLSSSIFAVPIKRLADAVFVEVGEPYSRTLYQAQKAIIHASLALKKNGILCFSAHCSEGIGDRGFYDLLSGFTDPHDVLAFLKKGYKFGYHKSYHMARIALDHKIWAVTEADESVMKKVFIEKIPFVEKLYEKVEEEKLFMYHIPRGEITVPRYLS